MTRRVGVWLIGLLLSGVGVGAVSYIADEQVTVANTAIGFTAARITPSGLPQAVIAVCDLETAQVRYTLDGQAPTTTVGHPWNPGTTLIFTGHDTLDRFRAIRTTGTSGLMTCTYSAP